MVSIYGMRSGFSQLVAKQIFDAFHRIDWAWLINKIVPRKVRKFSEHISTGLEPNNFKRFWPNYAAFQKFRILKTPKNTQAVQFSDNALKYGAG